MSIITFDQFGRKIGNAAADLEGGAAKILLSSSEDLASLIAVAYKGATGGDGRLSGTGTSRRGPQKSMAGAGREAPVAARAKGVRRYSTGTFVGLVIPTGPYGLIEGAGASRRVKAHIISPWGTLEQRARRVRAVGRAVAKQRRAGQDVSAVAAVRAARSQMDVRRALAFPGAGHDKRGYAAVVKHPGTKGRDVMDSAVIGAGRVILKGLAVKTQKQIIDGYRRPA